MILAAALLLISSDGKRVSIDAAKELALTEEAESVTQLSCCLFEAGYDGDSAQKLCYVKGAVCTNRERHPQGQHDKFESCSLLCTVKDSKVLVNLKDSKVFVNLMPSKDRAHEASVAKKSAAHRAVAKKEAAEKAAAQSTEPKEARSSAIHSLPLVALLASMVAAI